MVLSTSAVLKTRLVDQTAPAGMQVGHVETREALQIAVPLAIRAERCNRPNSIRVQAHDVGGLSIVNRQGGDVR